MYNVPVQTFLKGGYKHWCKLEAGMEGIWDEVYWSNLLQPRGQSGSSFIRYTQEQHAGVQTDGEENTEKHSHTSWAFFLKRYITPKKKNTLKYKKSKVPVCSGDQMESAIYFVPTHIFTITRWFAENTKGKWNSNHTLYAVTQLWRRAAGSPSAVCVMRWHGLFKLVADEHLMAARLLGSTSRSSRRPSLLTAPWNLLMLITEGENVNSFFPVTLEKCWFRLN